ncbi:MAG: heme exporter protein CcmD [Pseudomonadota bacterium]
MFGQYAGFIVPAYVISAAVIAGLVVWTVLVYRNRRTEILELEKRGVKRRNQKEPK